MAFSHIYIFPTSREKFLKKGKNYKKEKRLNTCFRVMPILTLCFGRKESREEKETLKSLPSLFGSTN